MVRAPPKHSSVANCLINRILLQALPGQKLWPETNEKPHIYTHYTLSTIQHLSCVYLISHAFDIKPGRIGDHKQLKPFTNIDKHEVPEASPNTINFSNFQIFNFPNQKLWSTDFPKSSKSQIPIFTTILFGSASICSYILKYFRYLGMHKYRAPGVQKSRNHENVRSWSLT